MEKQFSVNEEKNSIRCMMYCSDPHKIDKVILFGHGFGGHMRNKAAMRFADRVLEKNKNIAVVVFNWPCHGEDSRKKITLEDCSTYLRLLIAYIKQRWDVKELYGYATSFGGFCFLRYITESGNPFKKMALRCPVIDLYDVLVNSIIKEDELEKLMKGKKVSVGFDRKVEITPDFLEEVKNGSVAGNDYIDYADDILILHGTKDEIVPMRGVEEFADRNIIEFIPIENADHRFVDQNLMRLANEKIIEFMGLK